MAKFVNCGGEENTRATVIAIFWTVVDKLDRPAVSNLRVLHDHHTGGEEVLFSYAFQ